MRGFSNVIALQGLRASGIGGRGTPAATRLLNGKMHKGGMEGYVPNVLPFPSIVLGGSTLNVEIDWPFPQIFRTDSGLYVGTRTGLYSLVYGEGDWIATLITGVYTHGVSWPWTLANAPLFPVFASGDCLVYYDYDNTSWAVWNKNYSAETINGTRWSSDWHQPVSACYINGQVVVAGSITASGTPSQSRTVRWTEIGQFDFLGKTANVTKNEAGEAYGQVDDLEIMMRVLPLGKAIIVYGALGVFEMIPVTAPAPTFSFKLIGEVNTGICNPLAVGGDTHKHLVVGKDGVLYLLTRGADFRESTTVKKLGYEEYLRPLTDNCDISNKDGIVSVVYNKALDEFYIGDGKQSYVYSEESGLSEVDLIITSLMDYENANVTGASYMVDLMQGQVGFVESLGSQGQFYYESDIEDFKINAIKTIEGLSVHGTFDDKSALEVMVKWRNDKRGSFRETGWKRISPDGFTSPMVSGAEFKLCIRCKLATGIELNSMAVNWKISDKRYIRGMYNVSGA